MKDTIVFDFSVSKGCTELLDETAELMDREIVRKTNEDLSLLVGSVDCWSAADLRRKYEAYAEENEKIRDDVLRCSEYLRRLSHRMLAAEEESTRIAEERD